MARRILRPFGALFALGLASALALTIILRPLLLQLPPQARGGLSVDAMVAMALIQPVLILIVAVWLGTLLAPRVGLRSRIADWVSGECPAGVYLRRDALLGLGGGLVSAALIVTLDWLILGQSLPGLDILQPRGAGMVLAAVLYGGIAEELMMRYGGMTLVAWGLWRLRGGTAPGPTPGVFWVSILVMALVFGIAHLGAAALTAPLTAFVVARTVLLNALAGVIFGWLYWRRSLESAMVAHGSFHLYVAGIAQLAAALSAS